MDYHLAMASAIVDCPLCLSCTIQAARGIVTVSCHYVAYTVKAILASWHVYHRLRGSASPVLTATHHSYGGSPRLSDFFFDLGSGGQTPQRTFTQNGSNDVFSRKDVSFAVKDATFHTP